MLFFMKGDSSLLLPQQLLIKTRNLESFSYQKYLPVHTPIVVEKFDVDISTTVDKELVLTLVDSSPDLTLDQSASIEEVMNCSAPPSHRMVTWSKAGVIKPNPKYALCSQKIEINEPHTIKEALQHDGWLQAMKAEINALEKNNTWTLVPREDHRNGSKMGVQGKIQSSCHTG